MTSDPKILAGSWSSRAGPTLQYISLGHTSSSEQLIISNFIVGLKLEVIFEERKRNDLLPWLDLFDCSNTRDHNSTFRQFDEATMTSNDVASMMWRCGQLTMQSQVTNIYAIDWWLTMRSIDDVIDWWCGRLMLRSIDDAKWNNDAIDWWFTMQLIDD